MKTIDIIREKLEALTNRVGNNAGIANRSRKRIDEKLERHDKRLDRVEKRVYFLESVEALGRIDLTERVGKWCEDPICQFSQHGTRWICNCTSELSHRRDKRSHYKKGVPGCRVCGTKRPNKRRVGAWVLSAWVCNCGTYYHNTTDIECMKCGDIRPERI